MMLRCLIIYSALFLAFQILPGPPYDSRAKQGAGAPPTPSRSVTWEKDKSGRNLVDSGCRAEKLSTSWAIEKPPFEIEQNMIWITETGTSYTDLYVRNLDSSPIQALVLVIEYTENAGQVLEQVPTLGVTDKVNETFHPPFPFERAQPLWKAPLMPGDVGRMQGIGDGVSVTDCPTRAKVTFAMLQSADGTTKTLSSPGWRLGPTPRVIPFVSQFPSDLVQPPIAVLARVKISASGEVSDVLPVDQRYPTVLGLIRDRMAQNWKFNPALYDGKPVPSDLMVLFRIHSERSRAFPVVGPLPSPVTLIDFFPDDKNPGELEIAYGILFSGSAVK